MFQNSEGVCKDWVRTHLLVVGKDVSVPCAFSVLVLRSKRGSRKMTFFFFCQRCGGGRRGGPVAAIVRTLWLEKTAHDLASGTQVLGASVSTSVKCTRMLSSQDNHTHK